jgi:transcriptional regulator with XRE-family HTH domain
MNVKRMRQLRDISQEVLAQRCGIYRTYLSRIESGRSNPSLMVIVALAEALEVEPCDLLLADCVAALALGEVT